MIDFAGQWEHFSHDADIGLRGYGQSPDEAFAAAAIALTAVICDPSTVRPVASVSMRCAAPNLEMLLVDWLNTLIYEMAVRNMLFSRFEVKVIDLQLTALAWGETVDRARHQPCVEVKGATYTELHVYQQAHGRWLAQCIVDV